MKVQVKIQAGRRSVRRLLAPTLVLLVAAACGDATPLQDFRDSNAMLYGILIGGAGRPPGRARAEAEAEAEEALVCPPAQVRDGTAHYTFYAAKQPPEAKNVRYQATLTKTARECDFQPDYMAIKVGFAGRVLIGPVGGPGEVTLPIRVELAGKGDAVLWSKTYKVPVGVPPNTGSQFFVHIIDDLVYQPRFGQKLSDFRIYVGYENEQGQAGARPLAGLR